MQWTIANIRRKPSDDRAYYRSRIRLLQRESRGDIDGSAHQSGVFQSFSSECERGSTSSTWELTDRPTGWWMASRGVRWALATTRQLVPRRGPVVIGGQIHHARTPGRACRRGSPGFTIAATLTLAIAIGATASVFGVVDGVLLKAFPYRDPDRVLTIWEGNAELRVPKFTVSPADFLDYQAQNRAFTGLAASVNSDAIVTGSHEAEHLSGLAVTPSYFLVLGITPVMGRSLSPDSEVWAPGGRHRHGYWCAACALAGHRRSSARRSSSMISDSRSSV